MRITTVGRGTIGGGLAERWRAAGHEVTMLGRDGGDASNTDVVVVAVPEESIADALAKVSGAAGKVTIDTTNSFGGRPDGYASLAEYIKSILGGPTAKSFSLNFGAAYGAIDSERVAPSNLFAADPDARDTTERLNYDAGFDPVYLGDLSQARQIEDQISVLFALSRNAGGPVIYRYAEPGGL